MVTPLIGIPQGSAISFLLFKIHMFDLFLFIAESNLASYADDMVLYAGEEISDVQRQLESETLILLEWFRDYYLKVNSGKSPVMLTTDNKLKINVKGSLISNEKIVTRSIR